MRSRSPVRAESAPTEIGLVRPPPAPLATADLRRVQAVFSDVDGTLTTSGRIESSTVAAIERLAGARLSVVLVTGRPAGWGECWARTLPVDGVIVENGGLYFCRDRRGRLAKVYAQPEATRRRNRAKLERAVAAALKEVRGARLSTDSAYAEVDLAIDFAEEVRLGVAGAAKLEAALRRRGVQAVRSSVHVNCWIGEFDKLWAVRRFIQREWKLRLESPDPRFLYVGDNLNDAPMFAGFSLAVGVANVKDVLAALSHPPAFVTSLREGKGFEELAAALVAQRSAEAREAS